MVVKATLVTKGQMTGKNWTCAFIDRTLRRLPVAKIKVDTPYYKGKLKAMCVDDPICELIIRNIPGSCSPDTEQDATAHLATAVTRAQAARDKKDLKPLKMASSIPNVEAAKLCEAQKNDPTLKLA